MSRGPLPAEIHSLAWSLSEVKKEVQKNDQGARSTMCLQGSFDCGTASRSEAVPSLRMTRLSAQSAAEVQHRPFPADILRQPLYLAKIGQERLNHRENPAGR